MNNSKQSSKKSLKKSITNTNINSIFQKIKNNFTKNYSKKIKAKKPPKKIGNYIIGETIGEGAFAKVKLGRHIPTEEKVAIKILSKERIDINKIKKEIKILQRLKHVNIIQIYEIIETKKHLYIIMEYCSGQDLFSLIRSKHHLTEIESCKYFQQIINGVEYIHLSNITHRDLKPENILLDDNNKRIVITDFGLSILSEKYNNELTTPCGTLSYAPPEILLGNKYNGIYSDIWSCGIILYVMLVGNLPCEEKERNLIYQNIITHNYYYPENLSSDAIDLLEHLLKIKPEERYSFDEIKAHPWFNLNKVKLNLGLLSLVHKIPIDSRILEKAQNLGYDKQKVEESVIKSKYNSYSAVYYLILKKFKREGIDSVSDLFSQEYINYLKNYKNWNDLWKINDPLYKDYEIDFPINLEQSDLFNIDLPLIKNISNDILLEENKDKERNSNYSNINYISVNKSEKFDDLEEKNFEKYINSDIVLNDMEIKFDEKLDDLFEDKNNNLKKEKNKINIVSRNIRLKNLNELIKLSSGDNESINKNNTTARKNNSSIRNNNSINSVRIHVNKKPREKIILLNEELSQNNKEKMIAKLKEEESKFNEELSTINESKNIKNNYDNNIIKIIAEKLINTTIFGKYLIHNKKSKSFLENKFYILQKYKSIIGLIERMRNKIFTKKLNDFNFYTFNEYLNDENDKIFVKSLIDIPYFNKFIQKAKETFYKKDALIKRTFSKYYEIKTHNKNDNNNLYSSYSNKFFGYNHTNNKNKYKANITAFTPNRNSKYSYSKSLNRYNTTNNYRNTPYNNKYKNITKTPRTNRTVHYIKNNTNKKMFRYKSAGKINSIYDNTTNPINIKFDSVNNILGKENKESLSSSSSYSKNKQDKIIFNSENKNYYLNSEMNNRNSNNKYINNNNNIFVNLTSRKIVNKSKNKIYNSPKNNNKKPIIISPYKNNIENRISVQLLSNRKEKEKNNKQDFNKYPIKELKLLSPINLNCLLMNTSPDKIISKAKKFLMKKGYFCTNKIDEYNLKAVKGNSNIEINLYKLKYLDNVNSIYISLKIKNRNMIQEKNFLNKLINFINEK